MASAAASQVKMGFWIAAGFWVFGIVLLIILSFAVRAVMP
jgi:acyl dehydratase